MFFGFFLIEKAQLIVCCIYSIRMGSFRLFNSESFYLYVYLFIGQNFIEMYSWLYYMIIQNVHYLSFCLYKYIWENLYNLTGNFNRSF